MNLLDIILILLVVGYGIAGFRQGFLVGALGVVGLISGGIVGVWVAPMVLERFEPSMTVSMAALGAVIGCALIGQMVGATLGESLKSRVTWRPAHNVDAGAGAVLSAVAALVVTWILGSAVAGAPLGEVSAQVRSSAILGTVDRMMPKAAERGLLAFSQVVDPSLFPRFLAPFHSEQITPAAPPDRGVLRDPDVARAADSVVRINGVAAECGRALSGSGFVYAEGLVMTNAHVVAGVSEPQVRTRDGEVYDARVVHYNSARDVAVLAAPDLPAAPLALDDTAETGDSGVVLGYPGNGELTAGAARIRSEQDLRGPDIYGNDVVRAVLSLYAQVRPGNSGGPLVSESGEVTGLLFAASVEDPQTGYALSIEEIQSDAAAGTGSSGEPVSTGACV